MESMLRTPLIGGPLNFQSIMYLLCGNVSLACFYSIKRERTKAFLLHLIGMCSARNLLGTCVQQTNIFSHHFLIVHIGNFHILKCKIE